MSVLGKWQKPSNQRQLQQVSFRPALHIMAKLNILKEMYGRNMTECINDLLADALERFENDLKGAYHCYPDQDGEQVIEYLDLSSYNAYAAKVEAETKLLEAKLKTDD